MSGELSLGLARGFRQGNEQRRLEAKADEERAFQRKRIEHADARVQEAHDYELSQRPAKEQAVAAQTAAAQALEDERRQKLADGVRAAQAEGFFDFMSQLDSGADPTAALNAYNMRGGHKIDPKQFKFDRASKNFTFVDDDGQVQSGNATQTKQVMQDVLTPSSEKRKLTAMGDRSALVDGTGKIVAKGALYGKETQKSGPLIKGKSGEWYRDPQTLKWAQIPGKPGKEGGAATTASGAKVGSWSRQAAQKSVRDILAQKIGLKYDPQTEQITGGKPGATDTWLELAAKGDEVIDRVTDSMGPAQIAHMVADAYSGVLPSAEYEKEAAKKTQRMQLHDSTKPDNMFSFQEPEERFQARVRENAQHARQAAMDSAEERLMTNLKPYLPAVDAGAGDTGDVQEEEAPDDEEEPNPDDTAPAVEPAGAPAATAPSAASAAPAGRGPRAHYPVTIDRVTGDADANTQAALKALRAQPQILKLLTTQTEPGRAPAVKFPDGNVYYLAGTQLKKLNIQPPKKGK